MYKITPSLILVTLLLVSLTAWHDSRLLFQTSVPVGVDGYYYIQQINTLRSEGRLFYPTNTPLVLYLLTASTFFISNTVLGIKICALILHLCLTLGVMALVTTITRNVWFGLCGSLVTGFSGLHLYLISEFLNNLGAMAFLIWGAWSIAKYAIEKKVIWLFVGVPLLVAAILSHRSITGLIILYGFNLYLAYLITRNSRHSMLVLPAIWFMFATPLLLAWQPFVVVPQQLGNEVLRAPALPLRPVDLAESCILIGLMAATLVVWVRNRPLLNRAGGLVLISIALGSLLITLNPFLNHRTGIEGIVGRLGVISYLQVAIGVPILLSILFEVSSTNALIAALFVLAFLGLSYFAYFAPIPLSLRASYLRDRENLVFQLPGLRDQLCEKPFIVARHGDQFLVTVVLNVRSQQIIPVAKPECLYWLIYQPPASFLSIPGSIRVTSTDFQLVKDENLMQSLRLLGPAQHQQLALANSHLRWLMPYPR